jgi:hypothetical protein
VGAAGNGAPYRAPSATDTRVTAGPAARASPLSTGPQRLPTMVGVTAPVSPSLASMNYYHPRQQAIKLTSLILSNELPQIMKLNVLQHIAFM